MNGEEEETALFKKYDGVLLLGAMSEEVMRELLRIVAWSVDHRLNPSRMLLTLFPSRYLEDYKLRLYCERVLELREGAHFVGEGLKNISFRRLAARLGDVLKEGRCLCRDERYARHYQVIWRLDGNGEWAKFYEEYYYVKRVGMLPRRWVPIPFIEGSQRDPMQ